MTVYQVSWYLAMGGPHGGEKYQVRQKSNKNCKISQKSILQFSEAPLHIPWCFICQKNSRASLIKWLKGYSVIFNYGREISNQSWHTNIWTHCRINSPPEGLWRPSIGLQISWTGRNLCRAALGPSRDRGGSTWRTRWQACPVPRRALPYFEDLKGSGLTNVREELVFPSHTHLLPFCMRETMAVQRLSSSSSSGSSTVMRNWGLLAKESR